MSRTSFYREDFFETYLPSYVKLFVASPEYTLATSHGEVKKAETTCYKNGLPAVWGLSCLGIFGLLVPWQCYCVITKRNIKTKFCEKCGVEFTHPDSRRSRKGHIVLAEKVINPLFLGYAALLCEISLAVLQSIISFQLHVMVDPKKTGLKYKDLYSSADVEKLQKSHGENSFEAKTGSEAIHYLLSKIDLIQERDTLKETLKKNIPSLKRIKLLKSYKIISAMIKKNIRPEWLVFSVLPIMPAGVRPMIKVEDTVYSVEFNEYYRYIVYRNLRIKELRERLGPSTPELILNHDARLLFEMIYELILGPIFKKTQGVQKSISSTLIGKTGYFRGNLEGKRVDFSARSVIIPDEKLKITECGMPIDLLTILFKFHLYERLMFHGLCPNIKIAKNIVQKKGFEIIELLKEIIQDKYIILNRQPTLHKNGILAFQIKMIGGTSIQLHPLVCKGYNADFDGDQQACYLPLSIEAQMEAKEIMIASKNILSPINGKVIISLNKDMVLGAYQLTKEGKENDKSNVFFSSMGEIEYGLSQKKINIHTKILAQYDWIDEQNNVIYQKAQTTPGRLLMWNIMPRHTNLVFDYINRPLNNNLLQDLMDNIFEHLGCEAVVKFADLAKDLTFEHAFSSGVSFNRASFFDIPEKKKLIETGVEEHKDFENLFKNGFMTKQEFKTNIINIWKNITEKVSGYIESYLEKNTDNHISMMFNSGARGSKEQIRQILGLKGLALKGSGEIYFNVIETALKDGLDPLSYFLTTAGARQGLKNRALNTAISGHLSRRLTDLAQDCLISMNKECTGEEDILIRNITEGSGILQSVYEQLVGRVISRDIVSPITNKTLIPKNSLITSQLTKEIEKHGITTVYVRSPFTCSLLENICALCYGKDTSTGKIVENSTAVGNTAAQSVGEPSTQLMMNTVRGGSSANFSYTESSLQTPSDGILKMKGKFVKEKDGAHISLTNNCKIVIENEVGNSIAEYPLIYGTSVKFENGDKVIKGEEIAYWDSSYLYTIAETDGRLSYKDIVLHVNLLQVVDNVIGSEKFFISHKKSDLAPALVLETAGGENIIYYVSPGTEIMHAEGEVKAGEKIAKKQKVTNIKSDIADSLSIVIDFLEVRAVTNPAVLATVPGKIKIEKDKNKRKISIICGAEEIPQCIVSSDEEMEILVRNNEKVSIGDMLVSGDIVLQNVLDTLGKSALVEMFAQRLQSIYRAHGINLENKHLELILRQMCRRVKILTNINPNCDYVTGEILDKSEVLFSNKKITQEGGIAVKYQTLISGVTASALHKKSMLSRISFQDPIKGLSMAALQGEQDFLQDIKSNMLIGNMIPAGTGGSFYGAKHSRIEEPKKKEAKE